VLRPGRELLRDGKAVPIGNRALHLLETMLEADGGVVTKADMMARVWPGMIVEDGNITVQIAALRKELGPRPDGQEWIVTVPRVGYRFVRDPMETVGEIRADGGRPSLAVLPFIDLSGGSSHEYFGDGIVADLITALSRFKSFSVVSRSSSFVYKGKPADVRDIARSLGVRYLLEGSVRIADERIRVTAQLVDAAAGTHLWAASFDGELKGVFAFQDHLTESVVGLVEPQIRRAEIERARRKWPDDPKAYDLFLRALPHFYSNDPAGYVTALADLERAITLEPDYAVALAYASWSLVRRVTVSLKSLSPEEAAHGLELARAALRYGGDDPLVLAICGHSLVCAGMRAEGLAVVRRGLKANPHNVMVLAQGGTCNMLVGDLGEAETCYRRVHQLSPGAPEAFEALAGIGFSRFLEGNYESALEWFDKSRASLVEWPPVYWMTIAAYAHLGRLEDARSSLARLLEFAPQTTLAGVGIIAARSDGRWKTILSGLERAGLR
jgi:TolB-like protein/Flp pilus assembly protein TadD